MKKCALFLLLSLLSGLFVFSTGHAKPFYQDEVIKLIVSSKPGGGYDYYGRLMAKYMQKYMPGSTIIVKNIPGAGNIIGCNQIYRAKPNGLTFGTFNRGLALSQIAGVKGVKFDLTKMSWLGSPNKELYSLIVASKYKSLEDFINTNNPRMAVSGRGTLAFLCSVLLMEMKGITNYKLGSGYSGGEDTLALMRGEMDGYFGTWDGKKDVVKEGYGRVVLFIGAKQPAGHEDVPMLQDVIKDEKFQKVIAVLNGIQMVGRPFAGPPGIPVERLRVLREAFTNSLKDPMLLKDTKNAKMPIDFVTSDTADEWVKGIQGLPDDVIKVVRGGFGIE